MEQRIGDHYLVALKSYELPSRPKEMPPTKYMLLVQENFEKLIKPLEELVENLGGSVVAKSELAGVLYVQGLSDQNIIELQKSEYVESVELPKPIVEE
ncbi:MAG: hypothetical protein Q8R37_00350 [Nanoarchaeota archaeon]|nr:hypothetical protein [Nanoarchaeota archaeon]